MDWERFKHVRISVLFQVHRMPSLSRCNSMQTPLKCLRFTLEEHKEKVELIAITDILPACHD